MDEIDAFLMSMAVDSRGDFHPTWYAQILEMSFEELRQAEAVQAKARDDAHTMNAWIRRTQPQPTPPAPAGRRPRLTLKGTGAPSRRSR